MSDALEDLSGCSEPLRRRDGAGGLVACREIEEKLKKSQRQLAEAQRIAHIGSWEWNIEENSMTWSDEMFRIFGLEPRPLFPTFEEVLAYIHEEDRAVVQESFRRALENLEAFAYEVRVCRPDGTVRAVYSQGNVIVRDDGSPLRLIAIEQDITERKEADNARKRLEEELVQSQKMEAIGRLAGGIAHDFNNILSAIQGYGELIQIRLNPTDPLAGMVGQILYAAAKAAKLTQSMLTFSRKQVITPKPIDVNEIIKSATALLVRLIGEDINIISLVILDVIMPKRNGREVYEEISRISRNMKYLFVSGYTADILERNGIQEPDLNFLPKPASPQRLLLKIRELLDA